MWRHEQTRNHAGDLVTASLKFRPFVLKVKEWCGEDRGTFTPPLLRFTQKKRTTDEPPPAPPMAPSSSSLSHAKRGRAVAVAAASSSAVLLSFFLLLVVLVPQHALNSPISLSSDLSVRPSPPLPPPKAVTLTRVAAEKLVSEAEAPGGRDLSMPPSPSPWPPPGTLVAAVLAQEPAAAPPPERRERRCDLHQGRWERDEEGLYPLYHPGSCPYVDEAFSCQENGRRDLGYLRWRWKPHGCDLPRLLPLHLLASLSDTSHLLKFVAELLKQNVSTFQLHTVTHINARGPGPMDS
ncbi:hypothetical protein BHM03_00024147 [Ensete ventricosum]|nr:hypothetical protein BHM03_00024147 [Ensete ventricosum]